MNPESGERETCPTCGIRDFVGDGKLIPVWEDPLDAEKGGEPDYLGCTECNTMEEYNAN